LRNAHNLRKCISFAFALAILLYTHGKNDFAEGSKILLNTDLKIILDHQNNFVGTKYNEQCCKKF